MTALNKLAVSITARATWKRAIFLCLFTYTVYFCMITLTIPSIQIFTNGMKIFDLMPFGYSFPYAETLLRHLGSEGVAVYLYLQLPLDFIYPGCMGLTGAMFIALLAKRGERNAAFCISLPLMAALMDYTENIMIFTMLLQSPVPAYWTVAAANVFTVSKSLLTTAYYVVLLALATRRFVQYLRHRSGDHIGA
jgi:hypothetical protein